MLSRLRQATRLRQTFRLCRAWTSVGMPGLLYDSRCDSCALAAAEVRTPFVGRLEGSGGTRRDVCSGLWVQQQAYVPEHLAAVRTRGPLQATWAIGVRAGFVMIGFPHG